jgi:hypothetical protein
LKENGAEQPKVTLKDKKVHGHDERPIHVLVAAEDLKVRILMEHRLLFLLDLYGRG